MKPHNLTLTMIGAGLLWFGWYGFNVGSIVFTGDDGEDADTAQFYTETGVTFLNTTIATMAAMLAWLLMERILHGKATRSVRPRASWPASSPSPRPAVRSTWSARSRSARSPASLCAWAVGLKYKLGLDDSLDVVGVHLVGGIVGTLLIGLFSTADGAGGIDGLFYGGGLGSLGDQALGALSRSRGPACSPRSSGSPSSTRWAGGSARTTRSTASTSPSTVSRPTTCTAGSAAPAPSGVLAAKTIPHRKERTHEAHHRGDQAAQVGGRPRGARDLRRHRA